MLRWFIFSLWSCLACACQFLGTEVEKKSPVPFPSVRAGDKVRVNYYADSLADSFREEDELFFQYTCYDQEALDYYQDFVTLENNVAEFNVPEGTAFIEGFFYTLQEKDSKVFRVVVVDEGGSPLKNAFQRMPLTDHPLKHSLYYHPENLLAYNTYFDALRSKFFQDVAREEKLQSYAEKHLPEVLQHRDLDDPIYLRAVVVLYTYARQFDKARQTLVHFQEHFPKNPHLWMALEEVWSASSLQRHEPLSEFTKTQQRDLRTHHAARSFAWPNLYFPHLPFGNKPEGLETSAFITATEAFLKTYRPNSVLAKQHLASLYAEVGELETAQRYAEEQLEAYAEGTIQHDRPQNRQGLDYNTAYSYSLMSHVLLQQNRFEEALKLWETAETTILPSPNRSRMAYERTYAHIRNEQAHIYVQMDRPEESLKIYTELYKGAKSERGWQRLASLFEAHPKELGNFDRYAQKYGLTPVVKPPSTPSFHALASDGHTYNLSDWERHLVVLYFFDPAQEMSAEQAALLNALHQESVADQVLFLGIPATSTTTTLNFPCLLESSKLPNTFNVHTFPTSLVLGENGKERARLVGKLNNTKLAELKQLLGR